MPTKPTKRGRCPTCLRLHKRTLPQNNRYWLLLGALSSRIKPKGEVYTSEQWHQWAKDKWLPKTEVRMPNGKTKVIEPSTADLDVAEFGDYVTKLEAWAAERGVWLEDLGEMAA